MSSEKEHVLQALLFGDPSKYDAELSGQILVSLQSVSTYDLFGIVKASSSSIKTIQTDWIPQFSNIDDLYRVLRIISDSPEKDLTWGKLGYYLCPVGSKTGAKNKYGENHYKLAVQLGLANQGMPLSLTNLGKAFYASVLGSEKRKEFIGKLAMRIPVIQEALIAAELGRFNMLSYLKTFLAESTALRRRSSITQLLNVIESITTEPKMLSILWNIYWKREENELSQPNI